MRHGEGDAVWKGAWHLHARMPTHQALLHDTHPEGPVVTFSRMYPRLFVCPGTPPFAQASELAGYSQVGVIGPPPRVVLGPQAHVLQAHRGW